MGHKRLTNPKPLPELGFTPPMECANVLSLPDGSGWTYEVMHEGYRAQAIHNPSGMRLLSHTGKDISGHFAHFLPELATAIPSGAKLDGTLVALDERGNPSYQLLQNAVRNRAPLIFYAFDLLALAGRDMTSRTLEQRRYILQTFLRESDGVQLTEFSQGHANDVLQTARKNEIEGVVAKREDTTYEAGQRTGAWAKLSLSRRQAFVIGGFTPGTYGFDELVIGFYRAGQLYQCALVRDGFIPDTRRAVYACMSRILTRQCPFSNISERRSDRYSDELVAEKMRHCVWIRPELVAQFGFLEWDSKSQLRHVKFLGLRDDKHPRRVTREF